MRPDELEDVAARHVPGQGSLAIRCLAKGLVNETYRVQRDGGTYALRVAAANPFDFGVDRAWEARVLERAFRAGLAPVLEYCDPQRGILILRWADGRAWTPAEVRRESNISRMAELLRRIHALPIPMPARALSPMKWIDYYSAGNPMSSAGNPISSAANPVSAAAGVALRAAAQDRLAALAALPGVEPRVCHSDLHTLNLLDCGPSLVLLDWEYAHASDPLWDLAGWSANNDLEEEFRRELLSKYMGRLPTRDEYLRLQLLGWLYDYVCLLWSELYLNLHRGAVHGAASGVAGAGAVPGTVPGTPPDGVAARAQLLAARLIHPSSRADQVPAH